MLQGYGLRVAGYPQRCLLHRCHPFITSCISGKRGACPGASVLGLLARGLRGLSRCAGVLGPRTPYTSDIGSTSVTQLGTGWVGGELAVTLSSVMLVAMRWLGDSASTRSSIPNSGIAMGKLKGSATI